jgi:hypothetical protein
MSTQPVIGIVLCGLVGTDATVRWRVVSPDPDLKSHPVGIDPSTALRRVVAVRARR